MTVRDWARASGTCRHMYKAGIEAAHIACCGLPPQNQDLFLEQGTKLCLPESSVAWPRVASHNEIIGLLDGPGLLWASKRWRMASVLHLQMHEGVAQRLPPALASQPLPGDWLTELQLMWGPGATPVSHCMASLLSHAPSLTLLAIRTDARGIRHPMLDVPVLRQLQHLVLVAESDSNDSSPYNFNADLHQGCLLRVLIMGLGNLPALKTLHLKHVTLGDPGGLALPMRMHVLPLHVCATLQHVRLDSYLSGDILLLEGCSACASFLQGSAGDLQDACWQEMLVQLRGIALSSSMWNGDYKQTEHMMHILQCCPVLRDLRLELLRSPVSQPYLFSLTRSLARLDTLSITAHDLQVFVPSCARWQCIRLWCAGRLDVTFEDVGAFARHARAFVFAGVQQHMEVSTSMAVFAGLSQLMACPGTRAAALVRCPSMLCTPSTTVLRLCSTGLHAHAAPACAACGEEGRLSRPWDRGFACTDVDLDEDDLGLAEDMADMCDADKGSWWPMKVLHACACWAC